MLLQLTLTTTLPASYCAWCTLSNCSMATVTGAVSVTQLIIHTLHYCPCLNYSSSALSPWSLTSISAKSAKQTAKSSTLWYWVVLSSDGFVVITYVSHKVIYLLTFWFRTHERKVSLIILVTQVTPGQPQSRIPVLCDIESVDHRSASDGAWGCCTHDIYSFVL